MSPYEQLMQLIRERSTDYSGMAQLAAMLFSGVPRTEGSHELESLKAENEELKDQIHKLVQARGTDLMARMFRLISEIRGPLYDHDMHDWEDRCNDLVSEYLKDTGDKKKEIPSITVEVSYKGDTVSHSGSFFMDAISFLCQAEASVRSAMGVKVQADDITEVITKEKMAKLIEGMSK